MGRRKQNKEPFFQGRNRKTKQKNPGISLIQDTMMQTKRSHSGPHLLRVPDLLTGLCGRDPPLGKSVGTDLEAADLFCML